MFFDCVYTCLLGLCPDWETWDTEKPVENATEAMQLADDWLGIPQVRERSLTAHIDAIQHNIKTLLNHCCSRVNIWNALFSLSLDSIRVIQKHH